ncbi:MAG: YeeE/YedE thiosulfate transporter family protein [Bacteroidota bacterium]
MNRPSSPYMNPYHAGIGLGLVLLAAFVIMGRGLGASGAFTSVVAVGVQAVAPVHAQSSTFYKEYLPANTPPLKDWLVFEIAGVIVGGMISGVLAGRMRRTVDRGPNSTIGSRLLLAFAGGVVMGFGSKLARGCTSGQALTGGALLSVGSWTFMIAVFASAYGMAYFVRRQWI